MANNKSKANLGKAWEDRIIQKCLDYRKENRAFIVKIPTEFTLIRGKMGKVVSAFPREKSILDFTGVLKNGQCLFIEAKSHANKTSFSLNLPLYVTSDFIYIQTNKVNNCNLKLLVCIEWL